MRDISLDLRLRAINLYVYSILLYRDETWTLYEESNKKSEALEMWIFKHLARVSFKHRVIQYSSTATKHGLSMKNQTKKVKP